MEVKETAACGISEREFAIELEEAELPAVEKMLRAAEGADDLDKDLLSDLLSKMASKEDLVCESGDADYAVKLNETEIAKVYKMLLVAEEEAKDSGSGIDADMLDDLLANMEHIVGPSLEEG